MLKRAKQGWLVASKIKCLQCSFSKACMKVLLQTVNTKATVSPEDEKRVTNLHCI